MACSKHSLPRPAFTVCRIEFDIHQLVHILEYKHVTVQLDNSLILDERERREFAPTVIEPRIIGEDFVG